MPSRQILAAALAAMVLLSGCSMFTGGGGGDDPVSDDGPNHHELRFYSNTDGVAYNGTFSVRKDGETVHQTRLGGDGNGTYVNVTTLNESGPYTVVVNTSLPESGGGTMHEEHTIDGTLGNATIVWMNFQGARTASYSLAGDDGALYLDKQIPEPVEYQIQVSYRGESIVNRTVEDEAVEPFEVAALRGPGVYRVRVKALDHDWVNRTVIVTESGAKIGLHGGSPVEIEVYGPDQQVPDDP